MECPIRLASVQAHSWPLGGSGHGVTEGRIAATPGGRLTVTPVRASLVAVRVADRESEGRKRTGLVVEHPGDERRRERKRA